MDSSALSPQSSALPPLSGDELAVWHAVNQRDGRERAISAKALGLETGLNERQVRLIVKHLVEEHRFPIGSTTQPPYGFFRVTTLDEHEEACRQIEHRIISLARRLSMMRQNAPHEILSQLMLTLWDEHDAGAAKRGA